VEGMSFLNTLEKVRVKRVHRKEADLDSKGVQKRDSRGNPRWRSINVLNQFQLDFTDSKELKELFDRKEWAAAIPEEGTETFVRDASGRVLSVRIKPIGSYVKGGMVTEVKPRIIQRHKSISDAYISPCHDDQMFVPHIEQERLYGGRGNQLHFAYLAIDEFAARHGGELPRLHHVEDAKAVVGIAKAILTDYKTKAKAVTVETIDEEVIEKVALFARAELPGFTAFLGGIAAQEIVKKFGRHTPICQYLYADYFELLPQGTTIPEDRKVLGSRYDHQIAIFGKGVQDKIADQRWFMVGSGALGCEYLKGIALMGVGSGPRGMVHVTDNDRIELSNLSRQFLFRQEHVTHPKSTCAAAVARIMNPELHITTYELKVGSGSEEKFNDAFWGSLNGVWNALDNVPARLYTDTQCQLHDLALLESGTEGTKCNSVIVLPHQSPSYAEGLPPADPSGNIPACTLKNFPYLIIHCIEWARPRFSDLFELGPRNVNTLLKDKAKLFAQADAEKHIDAKLAMLEGIKSLLEKSNTRTFDACIRLAYEEFVFQFRNRIRDLTHSLPADARKTEKSTTGEVLDLGLFWTGQHRFPQGADFDIENELHLGFLLNTANLYAFMFGVPHVREPAAFKAAFNELKLSAPAWTPPASKVDVKDLKEDKKEASDDEMTRVRSLLEEFKALDVTRYKALNEAEFEKDDDKNFHIDYITACSNMRAWNYKIQPATRMHCKVVSGRIIAALATTTALVSGLVELEFYKIVMGLRKTKKQVPTSAESKETKEVVINPFYNSNVNLATGTFNLFEVKDPEKKKDSYSEIYMCDVKAIPSGFSSWDKIVIDQGSSWLFIEELIETWHSRR
jgi:ubiquitin-activating enzyme E1